jgi:glycosyltransferase involved in cell wall biosynthesis
LAVKKRAELLIEAMPMIHAAVPSARLVLAGPSEGSSQQTLLGHAARLGVNKLVTLPGLLTGAAREFLLANSSAFCLPSDNENFGLAVAEALAHGLPVVTTTGVALHRLIAEFDAGIVIHEPTAETLGKALIRLLTDADLHARTSRGARDAAATLSWPSVALRLTEMYQAASTAGPAHA